MEAQEKRSKEQTLRISELQTQSESASKTNYPEAIRSLETSVMQKDQEIERLEVFPTFFFFFFFFFEKIWRLRPPPLLANPQGAEGGI